jgi:hypothetical protein
MEYLSMLLLTLFPEPYRIRISLRFNRFQLRIEPRYHKFRQAYRYQDSVTLRRLASAGDDFNNLLAIASALAATATSPTGGRSNSSTQ